MEKGETIQINDIIQKRKWRTSNKFIEQSLRKRDYAPKIERECRKTYSDTDTITITTTTAIKPTI